MKTLKIITLVDTFKLYNMNKKFLLGSFIIGMLSLTSCGGSGNSDPAAYNNEIITVINGSETNISEMNAAMASSDYAKAEEIRGKWYKDIISNIILFYAKKLQHQYFQ